MSKLLQKLQKQTWLKLSNLQKDVDKYYINYKMPHGKQRFKNYKRNMYK